MEPPQSNEKRKIEPKTQASTYKGLKNELEQLADRIDDSEFIIEKNKQNGHSTNPNNNGIGKQESSSSDEENIEKVEISEALPQEIEEGNIEYKLKLVNPSPERMERLVSQMKWRLTEGMGEAFYEIGVEDSGTPSGLTKDDMQLSLETLGKMASQLSASVTVLREREGISGVVTDVLVRKYANEDSCEIRVAIVGNVDSGKSTLLGVLTRGQLDNGRGLARMNVFTHKHEIETGRTSSISHEILGFDAKGNVVNSVGIRNMSSTEICEASAKIVNFIDLAGHEKYLKTTVFGLTGHAPDFSMLMIGANMGVSGMTKEHLGISLALRVPVYVVITKIDMCPDNILKETLQQVKKILKSPGAKKIPIVVRNEDDVVVCARNFVSERICPIFCVSNVKGTNLDLLRKFLNLLPVRTEWESLYQKPVEFHIDANWSVLGVGTVASGTLMSGSISNNQQLLLGPNEFGKFTPISIKSIHTKRTPVKGVKAGQTAALALKKVKRSQLRKGMVILDPLLKPMACREFEAEILILYHSTTIQPNYQAVVHCGVAQQTAKIVSMEEELLRTGDKAKCRLRFMYWPEYIKEGSRMIFREGRTKGIGRVTKIFAPEEEVGKDYVKKKTHPTMNQNNNNNDNNAK